MVDNTVDKIIYKVIVELYSKGFRVKHVDYIVQTESEKSFITYDGKKILKKRFLKPDTKIHDNPEYFNYFTYCLQEDLEKAEELLKNEIESKVKEFYKKINKLKKYII